ncbi:MAG: flavodoxin family protein [Clostridiales bacterium]|nr:flavodoxin family protein [Clostridiales bacterium]
MKTLVFFGSPRAGGDTAQLVRALTDGLPGEPIWVDAYRAGISPCVDCRACMVRAGCAIDDPMTDVYRQIEEADAIAVASPVHFSGLSGPLLSLFGRLQTYYCARRFRGVEPIQKPKRGAILLAAGGDGAPERAIEQARELLKNMGARDIAPPVVSGPPTIARPKRTPRRCPKPGHWPGGWPARRARRPSFVRSTRPTAGKSIGLSGHTGMPPTWRCAAGWST